MFMYAIIRADDTIDMLGTDTQPSYDQIVQHVGGLLEGVAIQNTTSYINEEGKIMGLPVNKIATVLAHADEAIMPSDHICGDMVVFGPLDEDGEITSLHSTFVPRLMHELGVTLTDMEETGV